MSQYAPDIKVLAQDPAPTLKRIADIVSKYSFSGLLSLMNLRFEIDGNAASDVAITLFVTIPDRAGSDLSELSELASTWTLAASFVRDAADVEIRHSIEKQFQKLWYHEYEESINYEGAIIRDPHRWEDVEKYHAELLHAEHERKQRAMSR